MDADKYITLTCCYSGKFMSEINFHDGSFQPQTTVITPYLAVVSVGHDCITRKRSVVFVLENVSLAYSLHVSRLSISLSLSVVSASTIYK